MSSLLQQQRLQVLGAQTVIDLFNEADKPLSGEPFTGTEPGYLETIGKGVMRGGVKAARGALLATSVFAENKDPLFKFNDDYLDTAEKYWSVDTPTMTTAKKIVSGMSELPLQLVGGGSFAALSAAMNTGKEMVEQGVDGQTAALIGAGAGATMGAMIALPQAGNTIKQTLALIASNPALGYAQDFATKKLLQSQGYDEQAKNIDPFDIPARSIDLLLGGIFGGVAHYGKWRAKAPTAVIDAIDTVERGKQAESLNPFNDHSGQHIDALDSALESITSGKPVDVKQHLPSIEPEPLGMTAERFRQDAQAHFGLSNDQTDAAIALVAARAKSAGEDLDAYISKRISAITDAAPEGAALFQDQPMVQPFYSKLLAEVDGLRQEKWQASDLLNKLTKSPGVKGEEISWTGLDEFLAGKKQVTREEVRAFLEENQVQVQEVTKGEVQTVTAKPVQFDIQETEHQWVAVDASGKELSVVGKGTVSDIEEARAYLDRYLTNREADRVKTTNERNRERQGGKFGKYVTPGGENYRELLLTLPGGAYKGHHFDEPGILAHIRFNERTGTNGERIMHVEEVQSDWHQQGRDKGYDNPQRVAEIKARLIEIEKENGIAGDDLDGIIRLEESNQEFARLVAESKSIPRNGIPDAPFKKTWQELALKRALRYAAEHGFDRLTWTTGEQQASRYDLSKKLESVSWQRDGQSYEIKGKLTDGQPHDFGTFKEADLADAVGKDLAGKMKAADGQKGEFKGLDLKIGGEGMKGFYDKILPDFLNKFGKKFDAPVEPAQISIHPKVDVSPVEFAAAYRRSHPEATTAEVNAAFVKNTKATVHSIPITDSMRNALLYEGQPLFQGDKGAVSFLTDGRAVIHALEAPDFSTLVHELAHVFRRDLSRIDQHILDTWMFSQVPGAKWEAKHEEVFARTFERYLAENRAPSAELETLFSKFRTFLMEIYQRITGSAIDQKINPQVRQVFDSLLWNEKMKNDVPPEVLAIREDLAVQSKELQAELDALPVQPDEPAPAPKPRSEAQEAASDSITAAARKVSPEKDSIVTAISKLGGLDQEEAQRQWGNAVRDSRKALNDHVLQETRRFGAVFKKNGLPLDKMRDSLIGHGYLPEGATLHDLEIALDNAARGKFERSTAYQPGDADLAAMEQAHYEQKGYPSAADLLLHEQGDFMMNDGTNADGSERQRSAQEILDEARAEVAMEQSRESLYQRAAVCLNLG